MFCNMSKVFSRVSTREIYSNRLARIAVFSGLSVSLAYLVGLWIPIVDPIIAAITALISVRPTFHASMRESWGQVIGTVIGALFSIVFVSFLGFNILTLAFMIAFSFFIAWILKIGEEGAVAIGVTVILVAGPLFGDVDSIEGRLFGVVLGVACGLAGSFFVTPGKPHNRALKASEQYVKQSSILLRKVAVSLSEGVLSKDDADKWVTESQKLVSEMDVAKKDAEDAVSGAKWSPLLGRKETIEVLAEVNKNQDVVSTVHNICIDAVEAIRKGKTFKPSEAETISNLLMGTVASIEEHLGNIEKADEIYQHISESSVSEIKSLNDTQAIMLGGSIARDATKIKKALTED